jgi:hypothetical protein
MKGKALDRMEALNALAKNGKRNLTEAEGAEYELKRSYAIDLNAMIALAETELQESAPAPTEIDFMQALEDRDRDAPFLRLR